MENPKKFVFLYPEKEIFDFEILKGAYFFYDDWDKERGHLFDAENARTENEKKRIQKMAFEDMMAYYKPLYARKLNSCIHHRYRKNGFQVVYAVSLPESVIDVVDVKHEDKIVFTGKVTKEHYPSPNSILNQMIPLQILRIGGFHMWDCVERLARRAYRRGINTLVDEDLTEFFGFRAFARKKDFRVKSYPSYTPNGKREMFIAARKNKPWLWQDYTKCR